MTICPSLYRLGRELDDGGHRAGDLLAAFLHRGGADGDEPEAVLEVHRAGGDEGGELSQGMPGHHRRSLQAAAAGQDDAVDEDGRLGDARSLQGIGVFPEHDVRDGETEDPVGPVHHLPGLRAALIERLPHAGELGALSGKDICFAHTVSVRKSNIVQI